MAKDRYEVFKDQFVNPSIIKEFKGAELVGKSYKPLFDYFVDKNLKNKENIYKIYNADFVTIEDGTVQGGFGSAILEFAALHHYTSKIKILGIPDEFIQHGNVAELQQYCKIDVKSLEILFSNY